MSAARGHHFARPGNRFWPALHLAGLTPRRLAPDEDAELLGYGLGVTNVVDRPTRAAAELTRAELRAGAEALAALVARVPAAGARGPGHHRLAGRLRPAAGGGRPAARADRRRDHLGGAQPQRAERPRPAAGSGRLLRAAPGVDRQWAGTALGRTRPRSSAPRPATTTASRATRRLVASARTPITSGESRKPIRSSQLMTASPVPRREPGQLVGGVVDGRDRVATPSPASAKPASVVRDRRHRQRQPHAGGDERAADPDHAALPEPVDDPVAGEPADGHGALQRDEAESGRRRAGRQLGAQVEGAPRGAGVLDEGPARREDAERRQPQDGGAPSRRAGSRRGAVPVRPRPRRRARRRRHRGASRGTRAGRPPRRPPRTRPGARRAARPGRRRPAPSRPPLTAPMLQMPWKPLRIDRR